MCMGKYIVLNKIKMNVLCIICSLDLCVYIIVCVYVRVSVYVCVVVSMLVNVLLLCVYVLVRG